MKHMLLLSRFQDGLHVLQIAREGSEDLQDQPSLQRRRGTLERDLVPFMVLSSIRDPSTSLLQQLDKASDGVSSLPSAGNKELHSSLPFLSPLMLPPRQLLHHHMHAVQFGHHTVQLHFLLLDQPPQGVALLRHRGAI